MSKDVDETSINVLHIMVVTVQITFAAIIMIHCIPLVMVASYIGRKK